MCFSSSNNITTTWVKGWWIKMKCSGCNNLAIRTIMHTITIMGQSSRAIMKAAVTIIKIFIDLTTTNKQCRNLWVAENTTVLNPNITIDSINNLIQRVKALGIAPLWAKESLIITLLTVETSTMPLVLGTNQLLDNTILILMMNLNSYHLWLIITDRSS